MAIADDFSVANDGSGDIRYTGDGTTTYTVLAFKNYLGTLLAGEQASGDDLADITTDTIYDRSTDEILDLNSPFNVDDTAVEHLYDGSITQNGGDDQYSGLYVVGVVVAGTVPMLVQDNEVLPPYWGTGLNPDAAENVIMKIMVKTRSGGANINNKKLRVLSREFNDTYAEFDVTLGTANATAAIFTEDDINNDKSEATIEGYVGTILNTEGFQELNIDGGGAAGQEFYSKWDHGGQSLNDVYEFTKWIAKRSSIADENNAETGDDYIVDNATREGMGAEFTSRDNAQILTQASFWLKVGAGAPTGDIYCELYDSDDLSPPEPTGAVLATSEIHDANIATAGYREVIFRFTDGYSMNASQTYFIVIQHPTADASNYLQADGDATTGDDGTYAYYQAAAWVGVATNQLRFEVRSSPAIHSMAGELFRGITHEVGYDNGSGTYTEDEIVFWGTKITYDTLVGGPFTVGEYIKIYDIGTTTVINGGKVLADTGTILTVALENIAGGIIADGDHITGLSSGATADINTTITDDTLAGGEGVLLALDDNTGTGELYLQLISGAIVVENLEMVGRTSAASYDATAVINVKSIRATFVGATTGTNIIGAYGIGFDPDDVGSSDSFIDLAGGTRTPPNNVQFTVDGLVSGEDRILVGPRTGAITLNKALYSLNGAHNGSAMTTVTVNEAIQTETPQDGTGGNTRLRVELQTGVYRRVPYVSWTGSVFTTVATDWTDPNDADASADCFVAYIDVLADGTSESFTAVHATNRDILIRVRDPGTAGDNEPIKTIESPAQFTGSPQTITITRTPDA